MTNRSGRRARSLTGAVAAVVALTLLTGCFTQPRTTPPPPANFDFNSAATANISMDIDLSPPDPPLTVAKAMPGRSIGSWNQTTGDMVTQLTFDDGALVVPIPGSPVAVGYYLGQNADATGNFDPVTGLGGLSVDLTMTVVAVDLGGGPTPIPQPCNVGLHLVMTGGIVVSTGELSVSQTGFSVSPPGGGDCGGLGSTIGSLLGGPVNSMNLTFGVQVPADNGRYVATTGSDTANDCAASATPCQTINHAVSQATTGETVHVAAGTYPEMVNVDKGLRFEGANVGRRAGNAPQPRVAESVVKGFRSPGVPHPTSAFQFSAAVDGFTIDPQGDASLLAPYTHHLVALFGGPNVTVRNNILNGGPYDPACSSSCTTMTDAAVWVRSGTFDITDNTFTNFRSPIDVTQYSPALPIVSATISNNSFTHITNRAIWIQESAGGGVFPGVVVSRNSFDAAGLDPNVSFPAALVLTAGGTSITNNTIKNFSSGVFLQVCDGSNAAGTPNTMAGNTFDTNRSAIQYYVVGTGAGCLVDASISNNSILNSVRYGVRWNGDPGFTAPAVLNAGCNFWGSAAGPGPLDGEPDAATPDVDISTWNVTPTDLCTGA